jgi:hypothetical protein
MKGKLRVGKEGKDKNRLKKQMVTGNTKSKLIGSKESPKKKKQRVKERCGKIRGVKKNPNPLVHPNPPTNCPPKPTYLINGQMGASPIRPN